MSKVDRLDFSKPPPVYELTQLDDGMWWWGETSEWLDGTSYMDREAALKAAWAHCKARHDPPSMWSGYCAVLPLCDQYRPRMGVSIPGVARLELYVNAERPGTCEEAKAMGRAAAWAHYVDAVEVSEMLDDEASAQRCAWPIPLRWTTEERHDVRFWLESPPTDGIKIPEVLRG